MAFQLSPGINVSEIDLTNAVPAVGTSEGAFVGTFRWGPTNERVLITSEKELGAVFGKPYYSSTWSNQQSFFSAANFLGYSNALYVTRTDDSTAAASTGTNFDARYKGALGDSIKVISCDNGSFIDTGSNPDGVLANSGININRGSNQAVIKGPNPQDGTALTFNPTLSRFFNGDATDNGSSASIATIDTSSVDASNGQFTTGSAHGFGSGDKVNVTLGGVFAPLTNNQDYFVNVVSSTEFTLHLTEAEGVSGANPVAVTAGEISGASGTITFTRATVANNTFQILGHGLSDGDDIRYNKPNGGAVIGGLTDGQTLYVVNATTDTFQVQTSREAAATSGISGYDVYLGSATNGDHTFTPLASDVVVGNSDPSLNTFQPGDYIVLGDNVKLQIATVTNFQADENTIELTFATKYWGTTLGNFNVPVTGSSYKLQWEGSEFFDAAPESGKYHIAVIDEDGEFTGTAGSLLESYSNLSTVQGAKSFDGSSAYIGQVLHSEDGLSAYITLGTDVASLALTGKISEQLSSGSDGYTETSENVVSDILVGWDLYKSPDEIDVSLLITGPVFLTVQNYVMDNIAEVRKDCVAFLSAPQSTTTAQEIVDYAADLSGSSYSVIDTGYKYQYDKYNDNYVWVPLNADVAGTCARTDGERDPWFSPAGYNRGQLKNVIKLKINPNKAQRDLLYKNNVNPVIIEPGSGAILFGDKTMQRNPSAFDRINVRRLFIVLEKAIALASKSTLFEFNDEFTRATFRNMIEPFLRDVQGRRGIYDFQVVCDETNNTGEVIDTNRFIGDIYIKPARSINFIQLNFVAVRTGVDFNEIIGQ